MSVAPESEYLVPFDDSFRVSAASTVAVTERHPHKGKDRGASAATRQHLENDH